MACARKCSVTVCVDIGTAYTGFGYSCSCDEKFILWKEVPPGRGLSSCKIPTNILLNEDKTYFGYSAEEHIKPKNSHFYKNFKLDLRKKNRGASLERAKTQGITGKEIKTKNLFVMTLTFLKERLFAALEKGEHDANPHETTWVLTIPTIWDDEAKQLMREVAFEAGCINALQSRKLYLAYEPEVASYYIRDEDQQKLLTAGKTYMTIDCGGGTCDLVVHKVLGRQRIKEVEVAKGVPCGGVSIDREFEEIIIQVLGKDFTNAFKQKHLNLWFTLLTRIIHLKHSFNFEDESSSMWIELSSPLANRCFKLQEEKGSFDQDGFFTFKETGVVLHDTGVLILNHSIVFSLFEKTIENIIASVRSVLVQRGQQCVDYIYLIGGFSENKLFQQKMNENFLSEVERIVCLPHPQVAIIKGGVLYGQNPSSILSRMATRTLGVSCQVPFDSNIHDASKRYKDSDGDIMCKDVLNVFLTYGDEVTETHVVTHSYSLRRDALSASFPIYSINRPPRKPVQYKDDEDVTRIGKIRLETNEDVGQENRVVIVRFFVGKSELLIDAHSESSKKSCRCKLVF